MGRQAENIFKSFTFDPPPAPTDADPNPLDPKDNYDVVLKKHDAYFVPKRNTIYERAKFYQRTQEPGESIECFVCKLHELAANCRFEERETENIRDRLISGMSDKEMSLKLQLEQDDLTLVKAVEMARHKEMVNRLRPKTRQRLMPCVSRIRINRQALVRLRTKVDKVEDPLRRMGLNVRSAVMSIERPDARLMERGVIPARGGTTSLPSAIKRLPSKTSR